MLDQGLSWPLLVALIISVSIFIYFICEAYTKANWARPQSILAEFAAVFLAISVGIWINSLKRQIDRDDARKEREEERAEAADNLLEASIRYIDASIRYQSNDPFSFTTDLIVRPNILDTLVSSAEVAQRFESEFGDFAQQYAEVLRVSPASLESCGATREMYVDQRRQITAEYAANAWISHAFLFEINGDGEELSGGHDPSVEEILERIEILSDVHDCIMDSVQSRLHRSFHLYEALCLAADTANIGDSCEWTYITRDPSVREAYFEERYQPSDDGIFGEVDRDFSAGITSGPVWERFIGIKTQLTDRKENPVLP